MLIWDSCKRDIKVASGESTLSSFSNYDSGLLLSNLTENRWTVSKMLHTDERSEKIFPWWLHFTYTDQRTHDNIFSEKSQIICPEAEIIWLTTSSKLLQMYVSNKLSDKVDWSSAFSFEFRNWTESSWQRASCYCINHMMAGTALAKQLNIETPLSLWQLDRTHQEITQETLRSLSQHLYAFKALSMQYTPIR